MDTPRLQARKKKILHTNGYAFKDLNGNGVLDPYEDWRLSPEERAADLCSKMNEDEKAGMLMIDTLNAPFGGEESPHASDYVKNGHMRHFIIRNGVVTHPEKNPNAMTALKKGNPVSPEEMAAFTNSVQELSEASRLGIPSIFKSNARCHEELDARFGINVASGAFTVWPKEAGIAALRDEGRAKEFASCVREEFSAVGIRGLYGYMADLATEPRWNRNHETFTEDARLCSKIIRILVSTIQGKTLTQDSVAMTIKHFPGGGPEKGGLDPHYPYGKEMVYPGRNFHYHLLPFIAAIEEGASAIMPYYGIPVGMQDIYKPADDIVYDHTIGIAMAFNKGIVTNLLKNELGFKGYVNSDTGIINLRPWGLEAYSEQQVLAISINAGVDLLSGYHDKDQILSVIGKEHIASDRNRYLPLGITKERIDESVEKLLRELFALGLFENPYVDEEKAASILENPVHKRQAFSAQMESITVLKRNKAFTLSKDDEVYLLGIDEKKAIASGINATKDLAKAKRAIIRLSITNPISPALDEKGEPIRFGNGEEVTTQFGGALQEESDDLDFSTMEKDRSWHLNIPLQKIRNAMKSVGPEHTLIAISFRQAYVIDDASGINDAGTLLALFGVSDDALLSAVKDLDMAKGKLPISLANNKNAILNHKEDVPGFPPEDTLYPFGFGHIG